MPSPAMNPAEAVRWGPFVQAAYDTFRRAPGDIAPTTITNMPAGFTLQRTIQMTHAFGPARQTQFYGFVATGGDPAVTVVALRGTSSVVEWWENLRWNLVPFNTVADGGRVAQGFSELYSTFSSTDPDAQAVMATVLDRNFVDDLAEAARTSTVVVCGHSLGGALATLLAADLAANTPVRAQCWTYAAPRVGDDAFAERHRTLCEVSWRIHNRIDIVPYFPRTLSDDYHSIETGHAIDSAAEARWNIGCTHSLNTYLHVLSPETVPLDEGCRR